MSTQPRPHLLARAGLVDRLNHSLERAWGSGLCRRPILLPQALWERALRNGPARGEAGGRSAEDIADFRERLEQLCNALRSQARLNPLGQVMAQGQLLRIIRQRLQLGHLWQSQPDILETRLAPPIFVIGQMRSGTTRIHRLLAADPAHCATRFCDSWNPVPAMPNLRPARAAVALFAARRINPWLETIHPFGSTRADEELGWLAAALDHSAFEAQYRIPAFSTFSELRDPAPIYREFARILRTDANRHGNSWRSRVLKVPQFSEDLGALLARFPDARLVVARRDREEVLASTVSLVANQMAIQSDHADADWIRSEWQRKIELREARMASALSRFMGPVAIVDYEAMQRDWRSAIAAIYRELHIPLTAHALATMAAEERRSSRQRHGRHAQDLQRFEAA